MGHQPGTTTSGLGSTGASQGYGTTSSGLPGTAASQEYGTTSDHHPGRDAVAVGAGAGSGAGALGAGAYEYEKHRGPLDSTTGASTGYGPSTGTTTGTEGYQTTPATTGNQTRSQPYDQTGDRHLGRDVAATGAGAGATGVGAHEYSKHEAKETEREPKDHDNAVAKEKKLEKSERQHEKAIEKEEKHREKELAKEERAHESHSHRQEETAAVGAAGTGAVGAHEYDKHDNLGAEHEKERKPSLMQRILHPRSSKAAAHDETSGLSAADAADKRAFHEHGDAGSRSASITPAGFAEAPTKGYASQVTGGTGTTALAQGEGAPSGSHATALGNVFESR